MDYRFVWHIIIVLLSANQVLGIMISEVFYDAEGSDNTKEFIELLIDQNETISHLTLADADSFDTLHLVKNMNTSVILIVEDDSIYADANCTIYSAGSTIGNNLNNDADEIYLYDENGTLLAKQSYAAAETFYPGSALHISKNETWYDAPSPCELSKRPHEETIQQKTNTTNATIITTNETNTSHCNYALSIQSLYYFDHEKLTYRFQIDPELPDDFEITYWITDLDGALIKDTIITKNTKTKQYTPRPDERVTVYNIHAELSVLSCNETNTSDNTDEKMVFHIADEPEAGETQTCDIQQSMCEEQDIENELEILYIYMEKDIAFDKPLDIKLLASNADQASEISLRVETDDVTLAEESFRFFRGSSATFSKTLQLPQTCKRSLNATIIAEGFGELDTKQVFIQCKHPIKQQTTAATADDQAAPQKTASPQDPSPLPTTAEQITAQITAKDIPFSELEDGEKQKTLLPIIFTIIVPLAAYATLRKKEDG